MEGSREYPPDGRKEGTFIPYACPFMKTLSQLYRLRPSLRALHVPGAITIPPRWYRLGFLVSEAAKRHKLMLPFDQNAATC